MSRVPLAAGRAVTSDQLEEEREEIKKHSFVETDKRNKKWWRRAVNGFRNAFTGPALPMFMDKRLQMRGIAKWRLNRAAKVCEDRGQNTTTIFIGGKSYTVVPTKDYQSLEIHRDVMHRSPR